MNQDEVFTVPLEQLHLEKTISAIEYFFEKFDFLVNSVDKPRQRQDIEDLFKAYKEHRAKPYYGVFLKRDEKTQEVEYVRVGKISIHDEHKDTVVVNWTTDEGQKYVQLERDFNQESRSAQVEILNDRVESVNESNASRAQRRRTKSQAAKSGELGDIVDVIHPDQDDIVRIDHNGALVVEGGPGTGKTVVALQRIAYLLLREGSFLSRDAEILVVGPTASYSKYVKGFFPALGIGRVRNEDFLSACLMRLSGNEAEEFKNLVDDRDGVVRTKNSANVLRVIQGAVWPNIKSPDFELVINIGDGRKNSILLDGNYLDEEARNERQRFLEGTISLVQAQNALGQKLNNKVLRNEVTAESKSNRTADARRNEFFEFWLLKLGLKNLEERSNLQKVLASPTGGRYRRAMSALMNDYYKQDIEMAIELVAEAQSSDIQLLKTTLEELNAPLKSAAGPSPQSDSEIVEGDTIQIEVPESDFRRAGGGVILSAVEQIVQRLIPNVNTLALARRVCRGEAALYESVLGPSGKAVAQRLAESAQSRSGGRAYEWTTADLPIVAEIKYLVEGNAGLPRYSHVVIDEAQDLTRLQSRVISRFIQNSQVTLVGDINQATRSGSLASWLAIGSELGVEDLRVETLSHNYRVPQNIYDYARLYLTEEDRVETPSCDIEGGLVRLEEIPVNEGLAALRDRMNEIALSSERVAIITEDESVKQIVQTWEIPNSDVLTPEESKGLEVDHSIVYQPNRWFREAGRIRNLMYVVLTRATKSVTIIQHEPVRFGIVIPELSE